jgi:hypothetical protein
VDDRLAVCLQDSLSLTSLSPDSCSGTTLILVSLLLALLYCKKSAWTISGTVAMHAWQRLRRRRDLADSSTEAKAQIKWNLRSPPRNLRHRCPSPSDQVSNNKAPPSMLSLPG